MPSEASPHLHLTSTYLCNARANILVDYNQKLEHQCIHKQEMTPTDMAPKPSEPIAIVGSACRFAGDASSPSRLWELLREPRDLRREIPTSRFNAKGFYHPDGSYHGHSNVSHAYIMNGDVAVFDNEFFGIRPVEAKAMDPQQRFLMEVAFEGLESAGMVISDLRGSDTSVYVGAMFNDYSASEHRP